MSGHSAESSSLPYWHNTTSNNAMAGFYAFTPTNGGSPTVDTYIYDEYVARGGLNYGSTKKLEHCELHALRDHAVILGDRVHCWLE